MFRIKQCNPARYGVSEWQLEEAQVFWAKKEESLALSVLKDMIKKLDTDWFQVGAIFCVDLARIKLLWPLSGGFLLERIKRKSAVLVTPC